MALIHFDHICQKSNDKEICKNFEAAKLTTVLRNLISKN